ncbi:unnamed protein product [Mytilus coruscus]|uniref:Uncharacterized protein n=1 Tax=Mytilus coruscus TaxID=42192 RepID=A0A6J8F1N2_MYTCO|nr:unnamed protein product [Mytilus coruscus]
MYWFAASSHSNFEELVQKWKSALKHCAYVHENHGDLFPYSLPGPLEDREWIKMGIQLIYKFMESRSLVYKELEKVIWGRMLLKDTKKLSLAEQTSWLESFHNIVCYLAPKSTHFFDWQIRARLFLSVLHFNKNTSRSQATTAQRRPQFSISYPKGRKDDAIAKDVKVKQSFGYVDELMDELLLYRETYPSYKCALDVATVNKGRVVPPSVADQANRQEKENIVQQHIDRFNNH